MMYDRILFPTDGSEGSNVALDHAIELSQRLDAPIHALYVVDLTPAHGSDAFSGIAIESLEREGEEVVAAVVDRAEGEGIDATSEVVEGTPPETIVEAARNGDVVVMGTQGRTGLDRYILGSTTERVVRTSDVPVVTVPVGDVENED